MRLLCCIVFLFVLSVKGYSPMEQSLSCDFDNSVMPLCNWQHDLNDWRGRWKQWRSHTSQVTDRHLCLQLDKEDSNNEEEGAEFTESLGLTVRLWSQLIRIKKLSEEVKPKCLTLSYQLDAGLLQKPVDHKNNLIRQDQSKLQLSVLMRREGSCQSDVGVKTGIIGVVCANDHLWNSSIINSHNDKNHGQVVHLGQQTFQWNSVNIELTGQSDYKLILEGTIPAGYPDARICVDNITSYTEPCSALEKASAPLPSQWSWAQYFGLTFVGALILGLLIPVLFLIILIWACRRRRHHTMHSNYTNSKLFSTNLWYYIGGKEICDDPNGFRGSSSLLRSKQFNSPSNTGTLLNGGGHHHMGMMSNADVMDLPDVVIPGGRVVAFNYSGNTLGANTLRHNNNANNSGFTNTNYLPNNSQNGQVMLGNVSGTVSSSGSGANATTVARICQNPIPLASNELNQQQQQPQLQNQQQNEAFNYQTNPVFGEPVSMAMMTASQSPMLMTQSMAPVYGSEANHVNQANFLNTAVSQMNHFNTNAQVYNKPPPSVQQQQQQPRAQSQYFPSSQLPQSNLIQQPQPQQQVPSGFQQQQVCGFQNQAQLHHQQQHLPINQTPVTNQFYPQQQPVQQQQQQFPLPPPPTSQQLQQLNPQQPSVYSQQQQQQNQPVPVVQQPVGQYQFQQHQSQQQILSDQCGQQIVNGQVQISNTPNQIPVTQPSYQPIIQNCQPLQQQQQCNNTNSGSNMTNGQVITTSNNRFLSMSPVSIGTDSLTEADQQAAIALLAAATEGMDVYRENQTTPNNFQTPVSNVNNNIGSEACLNNVNNNNNNNNNNSNNCANNNNTQVSVDEDHPPPGYDEAIGLIQNNCMNNVNMSATTVASMMMMMNTMAKPAVPIPNTTCTPPPALPPRRIINGVGLEDIEDAQPMACLSLAERYGLPVAEI
ncbi:unnamed protein product [Heterobilharzia americana]|nr:unnamed protein product [Heterobilharzia americana]